MNRTRLFGAATAGAIVIVLWARSSGCPTPPSADAGADTGSDTAADASDAGSPARLRIVNACAYALWISKGDLAGVTVTPLGHGKTLSLDIPAEGQASTRYWAKSGCDADGGHCAVGQSSPPCPTTPSGCSPPVDSKLEATWGCTLTDKSLCGRTPQGVTMLDTFWNASAVDGYTFPFSVTVEGGDGRKSCIPADCATLDLQDCPRSDDLNDRGQNPAYASQDLRVLQASDAGATGCFSPCTKLNYPGWGGDGLNAPGGPVEGMYCCPTPPVTPDACHKGPASSTKYVQQVHKACKDSAYGYAYDDGLGARNCSGDSVLVLTFGPRCP